MYSARWQEFRSAIYTLLGYKIDLDENSCRLKSMYAERDDDVLIFNVKDGSDFDLLETEYSRCLTDKIEAYLGKCRSYPAFLSSLTLDLFNQRTYLPGT